MRRKYTILLALCDGEKYLSDLLKSIKDQTYTEWELVAFDDSTGDECGKIIHEFKEDIVNTVYYKKNTPVSGSSKENFSRLIRYARDHGAEYVMPADQDDVWSEEKITVFDRRMDKLEARYGKEVPLCVHCDLSVTDEELNEISPSLTAFQDLYVHGSANHMIIQNNVTGCASLMNRTLVDAIADRISDSRVIMHDHFAAIYASVFGRVSYISAPLVRYRQHGDNEVGAKDSRNIVYLFKRLITGRRKYREQMIASFEQSTYFFECYGKKECSGHTAEKLAMTGIYGALLSRGKAERLETYFKYRIWKKGTLRRVVQFIWG